MSGISLKLPSGKYRVGGPQRSTSSNPGPIEVPSIFIGLEKSDTPLAVLLPSPQEWDIQALKDRLYTLKYEQNSLFSTPIYLGYVGDPEPGKEIIGMNGVVEWLLLKDTQECYHIVTESQWGLLSIVEAPSVPPRLVLREFSSGLPVESWLLAPANS